MRNQQLLGLFALLTLTLAGAAIGQRLGLTLGEAVYASALAIVLLGWLRVRKTIRR